ncbi:MAG: substrate-binding domain-containing protein [Chthoniobacteraceae bacterium]
MSYHYQVATNKVRAYVKDQRLRLGDRLPSEREFAIMFGIGRPTVNKALACLISEGQLRREGYKLYVACPPIRERKQKSIGVLCPHPLYRKHRVSHNLVEATHDVCDITRVRFTPMLSVDGIRQQEQIQEFLLTEPDGFVIWPHINHNFDAVFQQIVERDIPLVVNNTYWEKADFVGVDNFGGIHLILNHLADLGHREVAYITRCLNDPNVEQREEAYRFGATHYFSKPSAARVWRLPGDSEEGLADLLKKNLRKEPEVTAICCSHDAVAVETINYCLQNGIDVPEQISIAGFDGIDSGETCIRPLTTVAQDFYQMGMLAVDLLVRRIDMKDLLSHSYNRLQIRIKPRLEVRQSTAAAPHRARTLRKQQAGSAKPT